MLTAVVAIAFAFLAVSLLLLFTLAIRRIVLARRGREYEAAEERVRPVAIALVEGASVEAPELSSADDAVLADMLGRFSRKLTGADEARIADYFRGSAAQAGALRELRSRRRWRRAAAAYRLGDMACPEVAPELRRALDDSTRTVRAAATRSLGRLGVVPAAKPIVEALVSRRVPNGVGGEALVELGPAAVPELRSMAENASPRIRTTAVTLIGLVGDSTDSPLAVSALEDSSADVRAAAAGALGRIGGAVAEPALRSSLDDRIPFVRAEAAASLGVIGSTTAVPRLLEIARTDRFRPARAAAQALARIAPSQVAAAAALPDAGPHLRQAADLLAI
jgi:HEAT repeat protein